MSNLQKFDNRLRIYENLENRFKISKSNERGNAFKTNYELSRRVDIIVSPKKFRKTEISCIGRLAQALKDQKRDSTINLKIKLELAFAMEREKTVERIRKKYKFNLLPSHI